MKTIYIAHRGSKINGGVENTKEAFLGGVKAGAQGLECDVRVTKDGVFIICHDETLERLTSNRIKLNVNHSLFNEIKNVELNQSYNSQEYNGRICLFTEYLDISQASEGHTLIVPKKHFENLFDVDQETLNHMAQAVKIVTNLLKEKLGVTDVNLLNNSGTNAGQTVMHLHFHIIPRKEGDNINFSFQENEPNFDKLSQTQKKLVENKLQ